VVVDSGACKHSVELGLVVAGLHHTPYDGHRMAYVVWIVWGSYRAHTVGKPPRHDRMSYGVCRMDRMVYEATLTSSTSHSLVGDDVCERGDARRGAGAARQACTLLVSALLRQAKDSAESVPHQC
jgi:hypothetical protein